MIDRVIEMWLQLDWREHGVGMLQAYTDDSRDARVHIWHRSLVRDGMRLAGAMHDHRFYLESTVLVGTLSTTQIVVHDDPHGPFQIWVAPDGARSERLLTAGRASAMFGKTRQVFAGQSHSEAARAFHWARQDDHDDELTVTLVRRGPRLQTPARILAPLGAPATPAVAHALRTPDLVDLALLHLKASR